MTTARVLLLKSLFCLLCCEEGVLGRAVALPDCDQAGDLAETFPLCKHLALLWPG